MPEPTYTITLTESERTVMARVLGLFVSKLTSAPVFVEAPSGGTAAARAVLTPAQTPAAAPAPPPIQARDRWARDRKGNEVPSPEGCQELHVHLWKAERKDLTDGTPRMQVAWKAATARESGNGNCFDDKLFPWLSAGTKTGSTTTVYVVQKGKYTNIVGVRA